MGDSPADGLVGDLVSWGLVDESSIVEGGLRVSARAGRHLNLLIESDGKRGFVAKIADPATPAARRTLRREGRFYSFCRDEPRTAPVRPFLPALRAFLADEGVLALDFVSGRTSLWAACRAALRLPQGQIPSRPFEALGGALATLHTTFEHAGLHGDPRLGDLPTGPPSFLDEPLPRPADRSSLSRANLELCRLLQADARVGEGLLRARKAWSPLTLIHGDVRSANLLVPTVPPESAGLRLLDWEFVQVGDPAWDVACALADGALFWLAALERERRRAGEAPLRGPGSRPKCSILNEVRRALGSFERAYSRRAGLRPETAAELFRRAVPFAAARLIQFAWEYAAKARRLPPRCVLLVHLATNLLTDPTGRGEEIFGIGDGSLGAVEVA